MNDRGSGTARIRVLVVDDDPDIRDVLRMALKMALAGRPHEIVTAENGREALESATADPPTLVLLDLMMPVMSGAELLEAMRADERLRSVPVVIVSAWRREAASVRGAQGILGKPIDMDDLVEVVEKYSRAAA